jgi:hypothetical protein
MNHAIIGSKKYLLLHFVIVHFCILVRIYMNTLLVPVSYQSLPYLLMAETGALEENHRPTATH